MCGPVAYNITVMPSHGTIMMINDTVYNITGLNYNTNYTITVYATNDYTSGEPAIVIVKTKPGIHYMAYVRMYMYIHFFLFLHNYNYNNVTGFTEAL